MWLNLFLRLKSCWSVDLGWKHTKHIGSMFMAERVNICWHNFLNCSDSSQPVVCFCGTFPFQWGWLSGWRSCWLLRESVLLSSSAKAFHATRPSSGTRLGKKVLAQNDENNAMVLAKPHNPSEQWRRTRRCGANIYRLFFLSINFFPKHCLRDWVENS